MKYILTVDAGTTSVRAVLYDVLKNQFVKIEKQPFTQIFPKAAWVEHNAEEIWEKVEDCIKKVCKDINPKDIYGLGIRNRHIGFVFQHFHLLPKMTALDNVALPLLYADVSLKERRERAAEALRSVGLEERMDFYPNQLSGGQCQRVAIARAMVGNPDLLLADEPTGALDTKSGNQIMEIFRQLSADGMTIVMITHEPSIADCADKTYRILDGELFTGEGGRL